MTNHDQNHAPYLLTLPPAARYAVHLWETKVWRSLLSSLSPAKLEAHGSCFAKAALAEPEPEPNPDPDPDPYPRRSPRSAP